MRIFIALTAQVESDEVEDKTDFSFTQHNLVLHGSPSPPSLLDGPHPVHHWCKVHRALLCPALNRSGFLDVLPDRASATTFQLPEQGHTRCPLVPCCVHLLSLTISPKCWLEGPPNALLLRWQYGRRPSPSAWLVEVAVGGSRSRSGSTVSKAFRTWSVVAMLLCKISLGWRHCAALV